MRPAVEASEICRTLPLNAAIVDPDGTIREVNKPWRDFGAANGLLTRDAGVGTNYFDVCPPEMVHELREVIARRRDVFTCIYPCHSCEDVRWMAMIALPLAAEPPTGLTLLHLDFTAMLPKPIARGPLREARMVDATLADVFRPVVALIEQTMAHAVAEARVVDPAAPQRAFEKAMIADRLAKRQREVLALLGQGQSNQEIAGRLGISMNTAKLHVAAILRRLGLDNRMQAVALGARMYGVVDVLRPALATGGDRIGESSRPRVRIDRH